MSVPNDQSEPAHWLQVLTIGRRPQATLVRILALLILCTVIYCFLLLPVRIEGISMQPTLQDRQIRVVNRRAYLFHEPRRGDIVAIAFADPGIIAVSREMLMKRIIALPGETVVFHEGHAYINGQLLDEPYLKLPCDWEHEPIVCGPNQYYVVGDNRTMPFDLHTQGRAERKRIVGKPIL